MTLNTRLLAIAALSLLIVRPGLADTAQSCSSVAATMVPPGEEAAAPEECSAYRAYYGIGQPADFALARACAFRERDTNADRDTPFRASAILAMIYANGSGVARNPRLAAKFACEIEDGAVAEKEARVSHLLALGKDRFDLCDDITSGYMAGYCEGKQSDLAQQQRDRQTSTLLTGASEAQRAAFDRLQKAGESYFALHADSTLGTGGTLRGAMDLATIEEQRALFTGTLARLEKHETPMA